MSASLFIAFWARAQRLRDYNYDEYESLEALREEFAKYVRERNSQINRSLGNQVTPMDRFCMEPEAIHKVPLKILETAFLHREERKVANDGTISLNKHQYETGRATIGTKVTVRYQPDLSKVYLEWEDEMIEIRPVDKAENAHTKRQQVRLTED